MSETELPRVVATDWKVEAVRSARSLPIDFLKVALNMAFIAGVGWYALTKMDGHVDKLTTRDVEIKRENDATVKQIGEQHTKAVTEIREGFRDASERQERLYERLMNRTAPAVTKGN